jgi:hypothetical protein
LVFLYFLHTYYEKDFLIYYNPRVIEKITEHFRYKKSDGLFLGRKKFIEDIHNCKIIDEETYLIFGGRNNVGRKTIWSIYR